MIQIANTHIDILDTTHGPEIEVRDGLGCTVLTVFEFEKFVHEAGMLARMARAKTSIRARHSHLPLKS